MQNAYQKNKRCRDNAKKTQNAPYKKNNHKMQETNANNMTNNRQRKPK